MKKESKEFKELRQEIIDKTEDLQSDLIDKLGSLVEKEVVFHIDKTPMYDGDKYYVVLEDDNYKLEEFIVDAAIENYNLDIMRKNNSVKFKWFTTKLSALNFILKEANEMFEGKEFKHLEIGDSFKSGYLVISHGEIFINSIRVWSDSNGWLAEPVKEDPLMLGSETVMIDSAFDKRTGERYNCTIYCKGESVTKKEWVEWYNRFIPYFNSSLIYFQLYLSGHVSSYDDVLKDIEIGCIKNITIDQIEAVTKALTKC